MKQPELMAPAGNFESMQAAIQGGADSVYFGIEQLNMRARATMNFEIEHLPEIAAIAKAANIKTYLTLNTIVYDHDLPLAKTILKAAKNAGINAVIAADLAIIQMAVEIGLPVHLSTQINITNIETIRFYAQFSDVMVLSRELSVRQIAHICEQIEKLQIKGPSGNLVEIEVFVHGALCMAVSGKCYLSLHTQNASANRGACIQNCRRKYKVTDLEDGHELEIDNEYIMSPKDLCTIDFLDTLLQTGIKVLKIEGRGKSADYVKTVTACYREAINAIAEGSYTPEKVTAWKTRMEEVYNRGFWGGYYMGQPIGEWNDVSGSKATKKKIYIGKGSHYYPKIKIAEFDIEAYSIKPGDQIMIIGPKTGVIETTIASLHVNDRGKAMEAKKGDQCAFPLDTPVRPSDKLYKIVSSTENAPI
ncbi:MAG: peptidase U32 family protein [Ferruginibacter sp.]